eukprot:1550468-Rhodomonas_salina.2
MGDIYNKKLQGGSIALLPYAVCGTDTGLSLYATCGTDIAASSYAICSTETGYAATQAVCGVRY